MMDEYSLLAGNHKEIVEELRPYIDAGLDGLLVILPFAGCTPDHLERVADAVDAALPARVRSSV
jgi:hypothetical protein